DPHVLAAVQTLLLPHAEELAQAAVLIGEQIERKLHLRLEFLVRFDAVRGDPDDYRARLLERGVEVAKSRALLGAAARIVLRVEVDDELPALGIAQLPFLATCRSAGARRELFTDGYRHVVWDLRCEIETRKRPGQRQLLSGSRMASRLSWSHKSMNSSRKAAIRIFAGMCTIICTENIGAPVCAAA